MKKIAIYYWHRDTLGHGIRLSGLAGSLHQLYPKTKIYLLNGGTDQEFLRFKKYINYFRLPFPASRPQAVRFDAAQERSKAIIKFIEKYKPDIFITENFPFGNPESFLELFPVLLYLKKHSVMTYASLGYPYIAKEWLTRDKECRMLNGFYKKILIHTPEGLENPYVAEMIQDNALKKKYSDIMSAYGHKTIYTGYVLSDEAKTFTAHKCKKLKKPDQPKRVLVMRGAGAYFPAMISHAILAKKILGKQCSMIIAAGPTTEQRHMNFYSSLIKKHGISGIQLVKYLPLYCKYLRESDVTCTMAGYNTSVLLMYYRKKSIVIPHEFNHCVCTDQQPRAMMLKDRLGATIITERTANAENMAAEISRLLKKEESTMQSCDFPSIYFEGGASTAKVLMGKNK